MVLSGSEKGAEFEPALRVSVPQSRYLVAGDIDGDGRTDLAGAGAGFWFALSGSPAGSGRRIDLGGDPFAPGTPVINELLAHNDSIPLPSADGRRSDFVEVFNASPNSFRLSGWRLRLTKLTDEGGSQETWDFTFPLDVVMESAQHLVIVCSSRTDTPFHTGFPLPRKGGILELLNKEGILVDRVEYGEQATDVSMARVRDGLSRFLENYQPDPGAPNFGTGGSVMGATPPNVALLGVDPATLVEGAPIRVTARALDDTGVAAMSVIYRVAGSLITGGIRVNLHDDGQHGDGAAGDGVFSGLLGTGFKEGMEMEFFLESIDLDESIQREPEKATFATGGDPLERFRIAIGGGLAGLEISEAVAANESGLVDEGGLPEDWVEIRNTSSQTISLAGMELTQSLVQPGGDVFAFAADATLRPGEYLIVFLDRDEKEGPNHAPFRLKATGEDLVLRRLTNSGAAELLSFLAVPPLGIDESYARVGSHGGFRVGAPTPGRQNLVEPIAIRPVSGSDGANKVIILFQTDRGKEAILEKLDAGSWTEVQRFEGNGVERSVSFPTIGQRFLRVRME